MDWKEIPSTVLGGGIGGAAIWGFIYLVRYVLEYVKGSRQQRYDFSKEDRATTVSELKTIIEERKLEVADLKKELKGVDDKCEQSIKDNDAKWEKRLADSEADCDERINALEEQINGMQREMHRYAADLRDEQDKTRSLQEWAQRDVRSQVEYRQTENRQIENPKP